MYQRISQVDTVQRIDSIVDQAKLRPRNVQSEMAELASSLKNQAGPKEEPTTMEQLEEIVSEASEALEAVNTQLVFQVHEGTGRPMIRLVESATQEVIREIPSEKMLDVVAGIWEWAGLIVDRKE